MHSSERREGDAALSRDAEAGAERDARPGVERRGDRVLGDGGTVIDQRGRHGSVERREEEAELEVVW